MRKLTILAAAIAATAMLPATASAITCYTVLDRSDATIYQDTQPPFDLSEGGGSAREAMRNRQEFMTISETDRCPQIAAPVGATGYRPATVDEIVSGIREYAKVQPGDATATAGRGGARASAAPARSSPSSSRKY
jgi:hypothetical protein